MQGGNVATRVRVLLVEDQADFRRLMVALLARQPDLEVVAQAGSLTEARRHAETVVFSGWAPAGGTSEAQQMLADGRVILIEERLTEDGGVIAMLSVSSMPAFALTSSRSKMVRFSFDAMSSFSYFPLQLATFLGFAILLGAKWAYEEVGWGGSFLRGFARLPVLF